MKERFTTVDLLAAVEYLNRRVSGMRVANIYDIDQKSYLLKLARSEEKIMLLIESGCRIHTTEFEWPKHMQPSGFAMKLRKHLRTKRMMSVTQLGVDRVIDLVFGSGEYSHHLIIELYDRGNIILTDHTYTILSLLRTRTDNDVDVRFAVRESFSMDTIKQEQPEPTQKQVESILSVAKEGDQLRQVLNPHFVYGSSLLTHSLLGVGLSESTKIGPSSFDITDITNSMKVLTALMEAHTIFNNLRIKASQGYLIQKKETSPSGASTVTGGANGDTATPTNNEILINTEFHPMLFRQHEKCCYKVVDTFDKAVDEFFSSRSSQKQDVKVVQLQKSALKKLDNIKRDHEKRLDALRKLQDEDIHKAQLIELNTDLVERACIVIRSAVASAMDWTDIELLVKEAQTRSDPVAMSIHSLKLQSNIITMWLKEQSFDSDEEEEEEDRGATKKKKKKIEKGVKVDIDLGLSVYANARKYYDSKKQAAKKEQKTTDASQKALKSAERKTKQTLKEAAVVSRITKARKVHWFEKFYWFISSENYIVIGGRDQQQNELLVKKYLNDNDVYVHADLHGATSVIVKNPHGGPVPPKTLNEAGVMAVCYSSAWEAKIITSAWWVYSHQVSKTAPSGEYLTTGSFMIRGKKNFLPPCHLVLGFSIMFKVDESSLANHINERRVKSTDDDQFSIVSEAISELSIDEEELIEEEENEEANEHPQPLEEGQFDDNTSDKEEEEEEEEEEGSDLLDTAINIHSSLGGVQFQFQRSISGTSKASESEQLDIPTHESVGSGHRHMSAKEKRMLKKQSRGSSAVVTEEATPTPSKPHPKPTDQQQPQIHYKRGQRGKHKKIKDKYGDQDEEERELRMDILASKGAPKEVKNKKSKAKSKQGDLGQSFNPKAKYHPKQHQAKSHSSSLLVETRHKQQAPHVIERTKDNQDSSTNTTLTNDTLNITNLSLNDTSLTLNPYIEYQSTTATNDTIATTNDHSNDSDPLCKPITTPLNSHDMLIQGDLHIPPPSLTVNDSPDPNTTEPFTTPTTVDTIPLLHEQVELEEEMSDEEEKKAILADENLLQLEEAKKDMYDIDSLTGCPLPDDVLLYAVPVCAPYSALLNYKFKVKLIPGTNRRGKAAKTAVLKFGQFKESTQLEKDLFRSIKDNDLSRYFPGKVKMTIPQQILRTKQK